MGSDGDGSVPADRSVTGDARPNGASWAGLRWARLRSERNPGTRRARPALSVAAVVAVFAAAGLLFATSAETARGTQLRADRTDVAGLVRSEEAARDAKARQVAALSAEIEQRTAAEAAVNGQVAALRTRSSILAPAAGLSAVSGPGVVVTLDDAPSTQPRPAGALPDELVVHQQDVQAVVNALWAGGAEAMTLMDQRVISTSAVRCVGNTLILQGQVYSPPFRVAAIGNPAQLRAAMASSPTIPIYLQYVQRYGLGWQVQDSQLVMPAYAAPVTLRFATAAAAPVPSSPASTVSSGSGSTSR